LQQPFLTKREVWIETAEPGVSHPRTPVGYF
jgi:hypothetical protein